MEANGVDSDRTAWRGILPRLEGHALRSSTLRVLEDGAARRARVSFCAGGTIRHSIMAFDIRILGRRNLNLVDGKGATGHGGVVIEIGGNAFALKATLGQEVALAEGACA